jgi:hypothetical protein
VFDGEIVAYDARANRVLPFQRLIARAKVRSLLCPSAHVVSLFFFLKVPVPSASESVAEDTADVATDAQTPTRKRRASKRKSAAATAASPTPAEPVPVALFAFDLCSLNGEVCSIFLAPLWRVSFLALLWRVSFLALPWPVHFVNSFVLGRWRCLTVHA